MTRPSGVTPRGLPFPGSADTHPRTPAAIEALAAAIGAAVGGISGGLIIDVFRGLVPVMSSGLFTVPFPRLAAVNGWFGIPGIDLGGTLTPAGWINSTGSGTFGSFRPAPTTSTAGAGAIPATITVHAIGWGPAL